MMSLKEKQNSMQIVKLKYFITFLPGVQVRLRSKLMKLLENEELTPEACQLIILSPRVKYWSNSNSTNAQCTQRFLTHSS